jgi:hypothetical protein
MITLAQFGKRANTSPHEPYDGFIEKLRRTQLDRAVS